MRAELLVGGRYRLESIIGAGGMAVVWRAIDTKLNHEVAVKHIRIPHGGDIHAKDTRTRAIREARIASTLRDHPNIVAARDVLEDSKNIWLILDFVPSLNLSELIDKRGPLEPGEVSWIGARIAEALAAGHAQDIRHRDIKPANILIRRNGEQVKLSDFGIAYKHTDSKLTQTGLIVGTPAYLAPEVARGGPASSASDMYSLGTTLVEAAAGRSGKNTGTTQAGELESILSRLLEPNPESRPDAAQIAQELHSIATGLTETTLDVLRTFEPERPTAYSGRNASGGALPIVGRNLLRHDRKLLMVAFCLVGVFALIVTSLTFFADSHTSRPGSTVTSTKQRPTASPEIDLNLPKSVGRVSLNNDAKLADPCLLIDIGALEQFGQVDVTHGWSFGACLASVSSPQQSPLYLVVEFYKFSTSSPSSSRRPKTDLGGITISWLSNIAASDSSVKQCSTAIQLSDNTQISVRASNESATAQGSVDACSVVDVGTAGVARRLATNGIMYTSDRLSATKLSSTRACDLFDADRARILMPSLDFSKRDDMWGSWGCAIGSIGGNRFNITYHYEFGNPDTFTGITTTSEGYRYKTIGSVPSSPPASPACSATLEYRQKSAVAEGLNELVVIHIEGPIDDDTLCSYATELMRTATKRLPR